MRHHPFFLHVYLKRNMAKLVPNQLQSPRSGHQSRRIGNVALDQEVGVLGSWDIIQLVGLEMLDSYVYGVDIICAISIDAFHHCSDSLQCFGSQKNDLAVRIAPCPITFGIAVHHRSLST